MTGVAAAVGCFRRVEGLGIGREVFDGFGPESADQAYKGPSEGNLTWSNRLCLEKAASCMNG